LLPEQTAHSHALSQAEIRENERLEALDRLDAVDAPRDEAFDGIVRLIKTIFDVPIAIVSVLDAHRQLYKASLGLAAEEQERRNTFCTHAILSPHATVVPDATLDPRFADNPHVTGESHIRFYAGAPLKTSDGHNIGTVCAIDTRPRDFTERDVAILEDLAALAIEHLETRRLAEVDGLTGVLSRRAFLTQGARAIALAGRHQYNLSLIAFDVDRFKSINDGFGHAAGDQVLADLAVACSTCLRASDIFGRIGGEEFAILLPHSSRGDALEVAERMRKIVAGLPFEPDGAPYPVTASFGVSTLDIVTTDMNALLANADAALYQAKAEGRNRVVGWRAQEKRAERGVRRRVLKAGTIHFNNRMSTIDCTVRSLADDGAGLDISNAFGLPERFTLMIRSDGIDVPCRIVSQTERHVEVEFTGKSR
jgi:diguanylate cyclase (GGDEF)-like protein